MGAEALDVLILGAGYTGSLAAAVLSRQGYSVLLAERGDHPRFAVGESCTPEQLYALDWLGKTYGIPRLRDFSSYEYMKHRDLPVPIWPKEAIYFLFNPALFPGPPAEFLHQTHLWPAGPPYHCLRSEYDRLLLEIARECGARYRPQCRLTGVDVSGERARALFQTPDGPLEVAARLVLDCSGFGGGGLAAALGVADEPAAYGGLRTWSVFSHFRGVRALESTWARAWPAAPVPRDNGTVHHVSPEGWAWVIPFDDGVTSVGVTFHEALRPRASPADGPAAFESFLKANPAFSAMMEGAERTREFSVTGTLQRRAGRAAGRNWLLLPPASGFTDPFFSPGNMVSASAVGRLALGVDRVLEGGLPADQALAYVGARFETESAHVARIIHAHYLAFRDPRLFEQAQALYWLALSVERSMALPLPDDGGPELFAPHWGAGDPGFNETARDVERLFEEGRASEPAEVASRVERRLREGDRWGLLASLPGRLKLTTFAHKAALNRAREAAARSRGGRPLPFSESAPAAAARHLAEVLLTRPLAPRTPASAGALRMLARHLRIALLGR